MSENKLSLKDFEVRYANIRKSDPKRLKCSVTGCPNPRDSTEHAGQNTSCAYHRLLFDFWIADVCSLEQNSHYLQCQKGRRRAFTNWRRKVGKKALDDLALMMAKEPINWVC